MADEAHQETLSPDYSLRDRAVLDAATRTLQAQKIWQVMRHFVVQRRGHATPVEATFFAWRCLDVGCSAGIITLALSQHFGHTAGVDLDRHALIQSPIRDGPAGHESRASLAAASALALPFVDAAFDVAVCNQVYQYIPDTGQLLSELRRILKPGGFCYFSARNLWGILGKDNLLPLLSHYGVLRAPAGDTTRKTHWQHVAGRLRPYRELRSLAERFFVVHDFTTATLSDPELARVYAPRVQKLPLRAALPLAVALLKPFIPTHLWVLEKPGAN